MDGDEGAQRAKPKDFQPRIISLLIPVLVGPSYEFQGMPSDLAIEFLHGTKLYLR